MPTWFQIRPNRAMPPLGQTTTHCHPTFQVAGGPLDPQVLKDENGIRRRPCDQSFGRTASEVLRASLAPTRQPFEDAAHAMRVLALCCPDRQLTLHTLRRLHGPIV
jgi:hypothetical protein